MRKSQFAAIGILLDGFGVEDKNDIEEQIIGLISMFIIIVL